MIAKSINMISSNYLLNPKASQKEKRKAQRLKIKTLNALKPLKEIKISQNVNSNFKDQEI